MSNQEFLASRHFDEGQKLHAYLMGGAGSAIAFALHETSDRALDLTMVPVIAAIVCWGMSFACGLLSRQNIMRSMRSHSLLEEAQRIEDSGKVTISEGFVEKYTKAALKFEDAQKWALLLGVVLYVGGHVWHLAEKPGSIQKPNAASSEKA